MMHFLTAAAVLCMSSLTAAAPLDSRAVPNPGNGWPKPSASQVSTIEQQAMGSLPNGSVPATLSPEGITNLQLIAYNELFEVEFFTSLLSNVTNNVTGFEIPAGTSKFMVTKTLQAILAQEELHALNANGALAHFNQTQIQPCTAYNFGTESFMDAIQLAGTFTSVVLGTLQDVIDEFVQNGDGALAPSIAAVIGNEAEQEGYFRIQQGQLPSELPFLTRSVRDFAFTALQSFSPEGACPSISNIGLKTYKPLTIIDKPTHETKTVRYSIPAAGYTNGTALYITYINQQNVPVTLPTTIGDQTSDSITLSATFPYEEHQLNGLTIASVSDNAGPYTSAQDVAKDAIYAPGLIIVQAKDSYSIYIGA